MEQKSTVRDACPVNHTVLLLKNALTENHFAAPKIRRMAGELLTILEDVAWGRAGETHYPALMSLLNEMTESAAGEPFENTVIVLRDHVREHEEAFLSHIKTRNCATGQCITIAPAPCQMACPAGIDIPTYVTLIGMGKDAEAIEVIREDNPFPWVCGLVCTRPCEFMCVRARMDTPVSIKFLKAFAAERAMSDGRYLNPPKSPDTGKNVCVIGAGPGGMSCAYYLALRGYGVRIIEALPRAGGMIMVGIPRYRLPQEVIDREVAMLEELGITFCFNTRFGSDVSLGSLRQDGFDAFFFAIGAHTAYNLDLPGEKEYGVIEAIDLLKRVALGERRKPGNKALVIGGGNVAIDAARTCLRLGCQEVVIAYRRTRKEMPADVEEVEQAEEEGVQFSFLTVPLAVVGSNDQTTGLKCLRAELVAQPGSSRMSPVPIEGSDFIIDADVIIAAVGQKVDSECMREVTDLKWTRRNTIDAGKITMETSIPGIFAGGDAVTGPATVIEAIGGGKLAAEAIHRYLSGIPQPKLPAVPFRRSREVFLPVPAATKMVLERPEMPLLNLERRRTTFQQVELGYSENTVREEARRCLRCDICRRCGECVATCRDKMKIDALQLGYMDFDHPVATDFRKTRDRCIFCGACANQCSSGAMKIENKDGERVLSLCGTVLNREELLLCESCGAEMGTRRYMDYVRNSIRSVGPILENRDLCDRCARKKGISSMSATIPVKKGDGP
ncbi:MAG: 4Fe-4S ferredoxin [Desulfobacteraceae bacterium]|nr:MAG: 4Fe-4S ferredoxin [Desulfobacteraceae bacterium]